MDLRLGKGLHGSFLVDTGSYGSYLTARGRSLLKRAGAKSDGGRGFVLTGASSGGCPLRTTKLAFDRFTSATMDPRMAGTIGLNLLSHYRVVLDLQSRTMRLLALSPESDTAGTGEPRALSGLHGALSASVCSLTRGKDGLYYAPVTVNGTVVSMCVDTGSALTYVGGSEVRRVAWPKAEIKEYGRFLTGTFPVTYYRLKDVFVAGHRVAGPSVVATVRSRTENLSVLGANALRSLGMLLDFQGGKMYVWPAGRPSRG